MLLLLLIVLLVQEDLKAPDYTTCGELEAINAWLGTAGISPRARERGGMSGWVEDAEIRR